MLWRIERDEPAWLYGTIHVADRAVLRMHPLVEKAVDEADALYTEIAMEGPGLRSFVGIFELPRGERLEEHLSPELLARVKGYLKEKKFPFSIFNHLTPYGMSNEIGSLEYRRQSRGRTGPMPLDPALYFRAKKAGKVVGGLETVDAQVDSLTAFTREEEVLLLKAALDEAEAADARGSSPAHELVQAYLVGDEHALFAGTLKAMRHKELADKFVQAYLTDRNPGMADRMDELLRAEPKQSMFFAAGAFHMPGDGGVIALLQEKGWKVERAVHPAASRPAMIRTDR